MPTAIEKLLARAEAIEGKPLPLDAEARASLVRMADGDGRAALTLAEEMWRAARPGEIFDAAKLQEVVQRRAPIYDKTQDGHYNLISRAAQIGARLRPGCGALLSLPHARCRRGPALHRAPRGAHGGRGYRARRSAGAGRSATPRRMPTTFSARPEGELAIAQAVIYVATAPKSNAAYMAYGAAMRTAKEAGSLLPPKHILNAPTKLMQSEGYGSGYDYDHDAPDAFSGQDYFPEAARPADNSTIRPSAASSARSGSGWTIGRSCAKSGAGSEGGRVGVHVACALASATPAVAGEPFDGRWANDAQVCTSEAAAMPLLVVNSLSLRWREAACAIRTSYRVRDAWHIGARCWADGVSANVPIKLELRGERLVLDWAGAPAEELKRCP